MDVRPLLRMLALVVLAIAVVFRLRARRARRARRAWPSRRVSGLTAGVLAVLAIVGLVLSVLDVFAPRAPVPDSLILSYVRSNPNGGLYVGDALEVASAATGAVRWSYTPPSGLTPDQASILDHGVFYLGVGDTIRAVRASDGQQLWAAPVAGHAEYVRPAVDHGVVYASALGGVIALQAADGSPLWHLSWSATSTSSAYVTDGVVYAAVSSGSSPAAQTVTVYALGASDGAVRWKYELGNQGLDSLTVADGAVYLRSLGLGLLALDAAAGRLLWQRRDLSPGMPPLVANGAVYLSAVLINSNPNMVVLALDARDGSERWRILVNYASQYMSVAGQTLYVGGNSAYALRTSDGHVMWRYGSGAQFYQPVVRDGVVFLGSRGVQNSFGFHPFGIGSEDFLNALDARTGELYWRSSGTVEGASVLLS